MNSQNVETRICNMLNQNPSDQKSREISKARRSLSKIWYTFFSASFIFEGGTMPFFGVYRSYCVGVRIDGGCPKGIL